MGKILGANGETLSEIKIDKEVLKGNKTIDAKVIDAHIAELDAKQAVINARPLLKSEDMKITPSGSMIIARGFLKPKEKSTVISLDKKDSIVPCFELMRVGPNVNAARDGMWATIKERSAETVIKSTMPFQGELFYFFQEVDIMYFYDEQPDLDDVLASGTTIVRDLTEYVKIDKMSKLKAKVTEVDS